MPSFDIIKSSKINKCFLTESVKSQFDFQPEIIEEHFHGEIPIENKEWKIGVICGRSGTGKSVIAQEIFPDAYVIDQKYNDLSVLENMPEDKTNQEITSIFNRVGFSSVPSWFKPYRVLSTGEKMRVDLSKALLSKKQIIVFDEFTSVVDRNIAKIMSMGLTKIISKTDKKIILVTCHEDILNWLRSDWTFNTNEMKFHFGRSLQRPEIKIEIYKCSKELWRIFRKYHYLNSSINPSAHCYVGIINNYPCVFYAIIHFPHPYNKRIKKGHRLVVLPDYQGIGIGTKFREYIAEIYRKNGYAFHSVTSNISFAKYFFKSSKWRVIRQGRLKTIHKRSSIEKTSSIKRITVSAKYIGDN